MNTSAADVFLPIRDSVAVRVDGHSVRDCDVMKSDVIGRRPFGNLAGLSGVEKQTGCRGQTGAFVGQVTAELIVSAERAVGVSETGEHDVAGVGGRQLRAVYIRVMIVARQVVIPIYEAIVKGVVLRHPGVGAELVEVSRAAFPEVVVKAE